MKNKNNKTEKEKGTHSTGGQVAEKWDMVDAGSGKGLDEASVKVSSAVVRCARFVWGGSALLGNPCVRLPNRCVG